MKISLPELNISDIEFSSCWRFTNSFEDELEIEAIPDCSYDDLSGLIIGTQIKLADGSTVWALLQNISRAGQEVNDHFLTVTINQNGEWFTLARYHDINRQIFGPNSLALFLGRTIQDIFPMTYDLRDILNADTEKLIGTIHEQPANRLSRQELISLSLI